MPDNFFADGVQADQVRLLPLIEIVACPLPACDTPLPQRRLWEEYRIEVPIIHWRERQFVTVSIQG